MPSTKQLISTTPGLLRYSQWPQWKEISNHGKKPLEYWLIMASASLFAKLFRWNSELQVLERLRVCFHVVICLYYFVYFCSSFTWLDSWIIPSSVLSIIHCCIQFCSISASPVCCATHHYSNATPLMYWHSATSSFAWPSHCVEKAQFFRW